MNRYYAFISGLTVLRFDEHKIAVSPEDFISRLSEILPVEELGWIIWLWFRKYHPGILFFLAGQANRGKLPPGFPVEKFNPEHETFNQLPEYLRNTVRWINSNHGNTDLRLIGRKLNEFYFNQLKNSENRFLQKWGESERNLLNYLTALRFSSSQEEKQDNLISGNNYYQILIQYPFDAKIVRSEFSGAEALEQVSHAGNYLERERTIDRFRWEQIDRINRFQYFTPDVILGYFQKLLIGERWQRIFHAASQSDPEILAEKMRDSKVVRLENQ